MKEITQITIQLPTEAGEALANFLTEVGPGVEQIDHETCPSMAKNVMELRTWVPSHDVESILAQTKTFMNSLKDLDIQIDPWSHSTTELDPQKWEEAYKEFFKTERISKRIVIQPSWEEYTAKPTDIVLKIDPGMAFGTGLHPSTRLVMRTMERLSSSGFAMERILDVGCGTGILSIAAAKLWPKSKILAVDNDKIAVDVTRENLQINKCGNQVIAEHRSATELDGHFNLVVANIMFDTLNGLQDSFRKLFKNFGFLILSGLLSNQAQELATIYCKDLLFEPEYSETMEGWRALLLRVRD